MRNEWETDCFPDDFEETTEGLSMKSFLTKIERMKKMKKQMKRVLQILRMQEVLPSTLITASNCKEGEMVVSP